MKNKIITLGIIIYTVVNLNPIQIEAASDNSSQALQRDRETWISFSTKEAYHSLSTGEINGEELAEILMPKEPEYSPGGCTQGNCCLPSYYHASDKEGMTYSFSMMEHPEGKKANFAKQLNKFIKSSSRNPRVTFAQGQLLHKDVNDEQSPIVGFSVEFLVKGNEYVRQSVIESEHFIYMLGTSSEDAIYKNLSQTGADEAALIEQHVLKTQTYVRSLSVNQEPFFE